MIFRAEVEPRRSRTLSNDSLCPPDLASLVQKLSEDQERRPTDTSRSSCIPI